MPKMKTLGAEQSTRRHAPAVLAPPPEIEPAPAKRRAVAAPALPPEPVVAEASGPVEPMTLRVGRAFKRRFKIAAAQHDLKLNELIVEAFDAWAREKGLRGHV